MIRDHIAANLGIEPDDFELRALRQEGGLGKVHQLFGAELPKVIEAIESGVGGVSEVLELSSSKPCYVEVGDEARRRLA